MEKHENGHAKCWLFKCTELEMLAIMQFHVCFNILYIKCICIWSLTDTLFVLIKHNAFWKALNTGKNCIVKAHFLNPLHDFTVSIKTFSC